MQIKSLSSGSHGNAYTVSDGETTLLLECGLTWSALQRALEYRVMDIDACLITHEHQDHAKSAHRLAEYGVDVYMSPGTKMALGSHVRRFRTSTYVNTIGSFTVTAFAVNHDAQEPVGYHITSQKTGETLVFITDTTHVNYYFDNVDYWMIEINYIKAILDQNIGGDIDINRRNRVVLSHMSLETAVELLKASNAQQAQEIYVLHLSDSNSDAAQIKRTLEDTFNVPTTIC